MSWMASGETTIVQLVKMGKAKLMRSDKAHPQGRTGQNLKVGRGVDKPKGRTGQPPRPDKANLKGRTGQTPKAGQGNT